jgi:hypothetical protein
MIDKIFINFIFHENKFCKIDTVKLDGFFRLENI